jgi:hypothetical protein
MGYKLLTQDMKTRKGKYNEMDWSDVGEWHEANGEGGLCTAGMIHDYDDPWIAVVMNPAHAAIHNPVMYETERDGDVATDGLKCGCKRLRLVRRVDIPDVPRVQRVAFAILAAMQVCRDGVWLTWARAWLSGEDRSSTSARYAAEAATYAAAAAAAATAYTAYAHEYAAEAAARAAATATASGVTIDWQAIKTKAMQIK